jgi:hypothetical protein
MEEVVLYDGVFQNVDREGACCLPNGSCLVTSPDNCGNTLGGVYNGDFTACGEFLCCPDPFADADGDGDADQNDFGKFQACFTGAGPTTLDPGCECFDRDGDDDVDEDDWGAFEACASGPDVPANPACDG